MHFLKDREVGLVTVCACQRSKPEQVGLTACQLRELISECVDALERFQHLNLLSWFITLVLLVRILFFQLVFVGFLYQCVLCNTGKLFICFLPVFFRGNLLSFYITQLHPEVLSTF